MLKAIFHINELDRWELVIRNLNNFRNEDGEAKLILLVNGQGVRACVKDTDLKDDLVGLLNRNIRLEICRNSLNGMGLKEDDIMKGLVIVNSGVVELAKRQKEGYSYIKP